MRNQSDSEYVVRVPLSQPERAMTFERVLCAFSAEQERSAADALRLIGVKTEIREGRPIKCMIFADRSQVFQFLSFWRQWEAGARAVN